MESASMAKGYWIAHIDVRDLEPYKSYVPVATAAVAAHGGRFLVRGGSAEQVEGKGRPRHVIIEFPTYEAAMTCYLSDEYAKARALRVPYSIADVVVVAGVE
jgi:uncharacterized protein (DUF1330 family)